MLQDLIRDRYDDVLDLLNCLKVGVYITDGAGTTILLNNESCKTGGLTRKDVQGRNIVDLEREGFVRESVTLKVFASGKEEVMIQELGDGNRVFCVAHPVYVDGKISFVVTTEKDITESNILRRLLRQSRLANEKYEKELEYLRQANIQSLGSVIASDENMAHCVEQAKRVAAFGTTVLLTGESGTGKEVLANLIYSESDRKGRPFIKVNCAAIPENLIESEMFGYADGAFTGAQKGGKVGYFELANSGTLFLDEIGEMPRSLQSKLLRVLQDGEITPVGGTKPLPVDVRLVAATNKDLRAAMQEGDFREDLYYRLAVMPIEIPPLRERHGDIALLAALFVDMFNKKYALKKTLEHGATEILERHDWPGNVRELQNVVERCMISFDSDAITPFQVTQFIRPHEASLHLHGDPVSAIESGEKTLHELLADYERQIVQAAMHRSKNASEASRRLGIDRSTLSRQLRRHGLTAPSARL